MNNFLSHEKSNIEIQGPIKASTLSPQTVNNQYSNES